MLDQPGGGDQLEVVALAAGQDGDGDLVHLGRGEDEHHVGRRLLQRLQQGVERLGREHVDLVDDVDLLAPLGRGVADGLAQVAGVLDAAVGGAVDLHHVDRLAADDLPAEVAHAAGRGGRPLRAAQRLGQDAGGAGLAHAAGPGEQEGVVHPPEGDGVAQRAGDVLLTDQVLEALRPVLARKHQVGDTAGGIYAEPRRRFQPRTDRDSGSYEPGAWPAPLSRKTRCLSSTEAMRLEKFTIKAQEALAAARDLASERNHQEVTPEHVLRALLARTTAWSRRCCASWASNPRRWSAKVDEALGAAAPGARRHRRGLRRPPPEGVPGGGHPAVAGVQGRIRLQRAPAAGAGQQGPRRRPRAMLAEAGRHPRRPAAGAGRGARLPARDRPRGRAALPVAGQVHPRPDRAGPTGQAGPGHRPRRGGAPVDAGAVPPDQEQPGADRRAGRGQDRHRRGHRPAHRRRRRARVAEGQAHPGAGSGRADRRHQVPGRVRGPPEGGAEGDRRRRGPGHPVHRRAAHPGGRRRRRGGGGRGQHAEAGAGPGRAALRGRHHPGRVPQAHREGQGAGAPVPAGAGGRAVAGGRDRHPARPEGALRGPPRHPHPRRRAGGGRPAVAPLHLRAGSCPTRPSTWSTRRPAG